MVAHDGRGGLLLVETEDAAAPQGPRGGGAEEGGLVQSELGRATLELRAAGDSHVHAELVDLQL